MDFLTRLRLKSPLVRAQYAIGTASVVTGIIALVWLSTLPARFADLEEPEVAPTPTLRTAPAESVPEEPVYEGTTEGLGALGAVEVGSTTTPTTTQNTSSNASTSRAIQIATTSQNHN